MANIFNKELSSRDRRWKSQLECLGASPTDFERTRLMLTKRFGQKPNFDDIIWSIFNELIIKTNGTGVLFYWMALFQDEKGRNSAHLLYDSQRSWLKIWFKTGVITVKICTAGEKACKNCQKLEGIITPIDQAFQNPIIPCKDCIFRMNPKSRFAFCRCMYRPEDVGKIG